MVTLIAAAIFVTVAQIWLIPDRRIENALPRHERWRLPDGAVPKGTYWARGGRS